MLTSTNRRLPSYALVDYDPDGIAILLTFKHGSASLSHEGSACCVSTLQWLGCVSDDIPTQLNGHQHQSLISLSIRDHEKAIAMLSWPYMSEDYREESWRRELQVMLVLHYKFEIELLDDICGLVRKCAWAAG